MTIREILKRTAAWLADKGAQSARLDAEVLLAHALGLERVGLYLDPDRPLIDEELNSYRDLIRRRAAGEPVAYLTGVREFYGLEMKVTPDVLIPRPETEMLVDRAREIGGKRILDLCTGSGCVAVACAVRLPEAEITATDISAAALAVARGNAERHGVERRIEFLEGDLFGAVEDGLRFDLILANPPYVAAGVAVETAGHEPDIALYGGNRGFELAERLLAAVPDRLGPDGVLLMEIGDDQAAVVDLLPPGLTGRVHPDLGGHPRVLEAKTAEAPLR